MSQTRLYCTLYLDGLTFGVEVRSVQEVLRHLDMTRVPLAHPVIKGLINLRGQLVTAIDMRRRLELPARDPNIEPMNVIIRTEDGPVSFLVDRIGDVLAMDDKDFEVPPGTLSGVGKQLVKGAYKLKDGLLLILDIERTVNFASDVAAA